MNTILQFDRLPGGSQLFRDYLNDPQHIGAFFAWPFRTMREFASCARLLDEREYDRPTIVEILRRQNAEYNSDQMVQSNIERLLQPQALTVFTGQQVGLYGGPLYTVYKALGAIRWAQRLTEELQRPVIPVFWLAADDHDFAEVRWLACPGQDNRVYRDSYQPQVEPERIPTAEIVYDKNIEEIHHRWSQTRLATEFSAEIDQALRDCFRPGVTMATAFARWMARVFAGTGLVFFSPAETQAKRCAINLFKQELTTPACSAQALELVNLRLTESGYHLQVAHPPTHTHLFYFDGKRYPLDVIDDQTITDGAVDRSVDDLLAGLEQHPEKFSPGVLLRPVMQNYLFPTVAYVGGPSEVTYWAQARALFEVFSVTQPVVLPRPFVTLVERKIRKAADRLELAVPDILTDREAVVNRVAQRTFPGDLQKLFAHTSDCFSEHLGELERAVSSFEPTLQKSFNQGAGKMRAELATLEKKAFQAHKRKNEIIREQVYKLSAHLYPEGKLQERVFGLPYYLNKYGWGLIEYISEQLELTAAGHQLVELEL